MKKKDNNSLLLHFNRHLRIYYYMDHGICIIFMYKLYLRVIKESRITLSETILTLPGTSKYWWLYGL